MPKQLLLLKLRQLTLLLLIVIQLLAQQHQILLRRLLRVQRQFHRLQVIVLNQQSKPMQKKINKRQNNIKLIRNQLWIKDILKNKRIFMPNKNKLKLTKLFNLKRIKLRLKKLLLSHQHLPRMFNSFHKHPLMDH